jgi:hypothetical protein
MWSLNIYIKYCTTTFGYFQLKNRVNSIVLIVLLAAAITSSLMIAEVVNTVHLVQAKKSHSHSSSSSKSSKPGSSVPGTNGGDLKCSRHLEQDL